MNIIVKPLVGISWGNSSILLHEKREAVESTVVNMNIRQECMENGHISLFLFDNDLRIDFDHRNCVEFIDFLGGITSTIQPIVYDSAVYKTNADILFERLKERNNGNVDDNGLGFSYELKNIGVRISRDSTPQTLVELLATYEKDLSIDKAIVEENVNEEVLKVNYWRTLGIGTKDYFMHNDE